MERSSKSYTTDQLSALLKILDESFSVDGLKELAYELDVDFENLPSEGKEAKARDLILYLYRAGRLPELVDAVQEHRPHIDREIIIEDIHFDTLAEAIAFRFSEEEIKTLSTIKLGIDYENLPAAGKAAKVNELVCIVKRNYQLPELIKWCQEERPNHDDWTELKISCPRFSRQQKMMFAAIGILLLAAVIFWIWWPPLLPDGFNIVVAEFGEVDENGRLHRSEQGKEISQYFYDIIEQEIENLPESLHVQLREPRLVGIIKGSDRNERASRATQVAERHNATILIYGVLSPGENQKQIELDFIVSNKGFDYGGEVTGPEQLGKPIPLADEFELNDRMLGRTKALQYLIQGLAYYYIGKYEIAAEEFRWAAGIPEWHEDEGKEIAYFLQGQAHIRAYDQITNPDPLSDAQSAFIRAYEINPNYARNYLGLGSVLLMQAAPLGPDQTAIGDVDEETLFKARNWFYSGLAVPEQIESANVHVKAKYGLGLVHLIGFEKIGWNGQEASDYFSEVVEAYEADPSADLGWFASRSHAYLGRLTGHNGDWETMTAELRTAIDMLKRLPGDPPKEWLARYWSWMAMAEENLENINEAQHAYEQAIELGTGAASSQELMKWQNELDRLGEEGE